VVVLWVLEVWGKPRRLLADEGTLSPSSVKSSALVWAAVGVVEAEAKVTPVEGGAAAPLEVREEEPFSWRLQNISISVGSSLFRAFLLGSAQGRAKMVV